jgi:dihydroflavonol-4-reductase
VSGVTLVTGGGGFIGSHVVRALVDRGRRVRVLARPGEDRRNLRGLDVEVVEGDVRRPDDVRRALGGATSVFHLAAVYALWTRERDLMREVNVEGTRTVLGEAFARGVRRVVYTSSIAVFGGQGPGRDATEESRFALGVTGNEYARSKKDAHDVALGFVARGHDVVIPAPCGPIGPGDVGPTPTGKLLVAALRDPWVFAVEGETNMLDVRDMARGHLLAEERGRAGESYLLGGENVSMIELAKAALAEAGLDKPIVRVSHRLAWLAALPLWLVSTRVLRRAPLFSPSAARIAALGLRADATKARRELGLEARPLRESVRDAVAWFVSEGYVPKLKATPRPRLSARA